MDWTALIDKNFANIVSSLSLIAIIMIYFFTLSDRRKSRKLELQHKQLEWKKQYHDQELAAPIIRFIDEELQLMDAFYWSFVDKRLKEIDEKQREEKKEREERDKMTDEDRRILGKLFAHREKEGMIQARVASFKDDEFSKAFELFSLSYSRSRQYINEKKWIEVRNEQKKAWKIAGTLFNRIGFQIPKH